MSYMAAQTASFPNLIFLRFSVVYLQSC